MAENQHTTEDVRLSELEEGDRILFGDRKVPCEVITAKPDDGDTPTTSSYVGKFVVETPRGKRRRLSLASPPGRNPRMETDKFYEATRPDSATWVNYFDRLVRVVEDDAEE